MSNARETEIDDPEEPRLEEFWLVLRLCNELQIGRRQFTSVRDLAEHLGHKVTTFTNQVRRVVNYLVPPDWGRRRDDDQGRRDFTGLGRESLFRQESTDQSFAITDFGKMVQSRIQMLDAFLQDFKHRSAVFTGRNHQPREVRVGGPQTIVHRLLAKAFSSPEHIHVEEIATHRPTLNMIVGNTYRELIPKLRLDLVDFVVGYGDVQIGFDNETEPMVPRSMMDPDIADEVAFLSLGFAAKMVFMCHPQCRLRFKNGHTENALEYFDRLRKERRDVSTHSGAKSAPEIAPETLDFRCTPLIAVPSWRQPPKLQFIMEEADRLRRLREVNQFDDALSLVRANCGVAIIGQAFSSRHGVVSFQLRDPESYTRPIGVYYRVKDGLTPDACRYVEFLRAYINQYKGLLHKYCPGLHDPRKSNQVVDREDDFPNDVPFDKHTDWVEYALKISKSSQRSVEE